MFKGSPDELVLTNSNQMKILRKRRLEVNGKELLSMFRLVMTLATLLATGGHAVVGCCWHHDHGSPCRDAHSERNTAQKTSSSQHACPCSHGSNENAGQADQNSEQVCCQPANPSPCGDRHDHGPSGCGEESCQYVAPSQVKIPTPVDGAADAC